MKQNTFSKPIVSLVRASKELMEIKRQTDRKKRKQTNAILVTINNHMLPKLDIWGNEIANQNREHTHIVKCY